MGGDRHEPTGKKGGLCTSFRQEGGFRQEPPSAPRTFVCQPRATRADSTPRTRRSPRSGRAHVGRLPWGNAFRNLRNGPSFGFTKPVRFESSSPYGFWRWTGASPAAIAAATELLPTSGRAAPPPDAAGGAREEETAEADPQWVDACRQGRLRGRQPHPGGTRPRPCPVRFPPVQAEALPSVEPSPAPFDTVLPMRTVRGSACLLFW